MSAISTGNVRKGSGTKVHHGVFHNGSFMGTGCAMDVMFGSSQHVSNHRIVRTDEPLTCKTCLGDVAAPVVELPTEAPETCATHGKQHRYAPKTIKAGTYVGFSCGCRVWIQG